MFLINAYEKHIKYKKKKIVILIYEKTHYIFWEYDYFDFIVRIRVGVFNIVYEINITYTDSYALTLNFDPKMDGNEKEKKKLFS